MVVSPVLRGLFGIEPHASVNELRCAPRFPANWETAAVQNISMSGDRYNFRFVRTRERLSVAIDRLSSRPGGASAARVILAPAFPLDAAIQRVTVNGRNTRFERRSVGDVQHAEVIVAPAADASTHVVFTYEGGTDVYHEVTSPAIGERTHGLRVLRSRAGTDGLRLTLEGRAGSTHTLSVRTSRSLGTVAGAELKRTGSNDPLLVVNFDGTGDEYVRKEVTVALGKPLPR